MRKSKYDDLCDEVEIISVNPSYAQVKHQSGREQTVSLRDLAPLPPVQGETVQGDSLPAPTPNSLPSSLLPSVQPVEPSATTSTAPPPATVDIPPATVTSEPELRRSSRPRV